MKKMRYGEIRIKIKGENSYTLWNWEINNGAIDPEKFEDAVVNCCKYFYGKNRFFDLYTTDVNESETSYIRIATFEMEK